MRRGIQLSKLLKAMESTLIIYLVLFSQTRHVCGIEGRYGLRFSMKNNNCN